MVLLKELFEEALQNQTKKRKKRSNRKRSKTGLYRVSNVYCRSCRERRIFQYVYLDKNGKRKYIASVDLLKLKEKIQSNGLEWKISNEYYARKTATMVGIPLKDLR